MIVIVKGMMSRASRELLTKIDTLADNNGITAIITQQQIFVADQITQKYYTGPVYNAIKSKVSALKNKSSKHFNVEHWIPVLESMFSSNMSVRRDNSQVQVIDGKDLGFVGFKRVSEFLITDYSIQDAGTIWNIIHKYDEREIKDAISVCVGNKVYNVQYMKAVLESNLALSNMRKQEIDKLRERANNSDHVFNRQRVDHSVIDMATSEYDWKNARENADLEKMIAEKFGE